MKNLKKILIILGVLVLVGGGGGLFYYVYESINFFSTQNAQVTANNVSIIPEITGKLKEWNVAEGDYVKAGQLLGKQDVSTMITTSALNPDVMSSSADALIAKADIKSPINGKIVQSDVMVGQVVSPSTEVANIADTSHYYIKANIEETDILHIKAGQKVDISIDAYPHQTFHGYVESIGQATESAFNTMPSLNTSGTYSKVTQLIPVHITIMNTDKLTLMLGMNATVKIHIK